MFDSALLQLILESSNISPQHSHAAGRGKAAPLMRGVMSAIQHSENFQQNCITPEWTFTH
jgi:hypothetical protein